MGGDEGAADAARPPVRWTDGVHEALGEECRITLLSMGSRHPDEPERLAHDLLSAGISTFEVAPIFGRFDYLLTTWAASERRTDWLRSLRTRTEALKVYEMAVRPVVGENAPALLHDLVPQLMPRLTELQAVIDRANSGLPLDDTTSSVLEEARRLGAFEPSGGPGWLPTEVAWAAQLSVASNEADVRLAAWRRIARCLTEADHRPVDVRLFDTNAGHLFVRARSRTLADVQRLTDEFARRVSDVRCDIFIVADRPVSQENLSLTSLPYDAIRVSALFAGMRVDESTFLRGAPREVVYSVEHGLEARPEILSDAQARQTLARVCVGVVVGNEGGWYRDLAFALTVEPRLARVFARAMAARHGGAWFKEAVRRGVLPEGDRGTTRINDLSLRELIQALMSAVKSDMLSESDLPNLARSSALRDLRSFSDFRNRIVHGRLASEASTKDWQCHLVDDAMVAIAVDLALTSDEAFGSETAPTASETR